MNSVSHTHRCLSRIITEKKNGENRKEYFPPELEILTVSRQEVTKDDRSGMGKI